MRFPRQKAGIDEGKLKRRIGAPDHRVPAGPDSVTFIFVPGWRKDAVSDGVRRPALDAEAKALSVDGCNVGWATGLCLFA
ncbi:hypothetical protein [Caenibacillus caldisaponilyticus]|uniref:hypothetical protein n=1 Tax=Caenibacillus caldisaponilyticus TaxID=1674942 RepID=UPI000988869A|nr:hypothetical protein [Caenibacillus caldisaponilyticus]